MMDFSAPSLLRSLISSDPSPSDSQQILCLLSLTNGSAWVPQGDEIWPPLPPRLTCRSFTTSQLHSSDKSTAICTHSHFFNNNNIMKMKERQKQLYKTKDVDLRVTWSDCILCSVTWKQKHRWGSVPQGIKSNAFLNRWTDSDEEAPHLRSHYWLPTCLPWMKPICQHLPTSTTPSFVIPAASDTPFLVFSAADATPSLALEMPLMIESIAAADGFRSAEKSRTRSREDVWKGGELKRGTETDALLLGREEEKEALGVKTRKETHKKRCHRPTFPSSL